MKRNIPVCLLCKSHQNQVWEMRQTLGPVINTTVFSLLLGSLS